MESKEKIRVSLFLDKNLVETADKIMKERGYRSRNQFYSALLADVIADEVTDKHKDILGEKFAEAMTEYVEEIRRDKANTRGDGETARKRPVCAHRATPGARDEKDTQKRYGMSVSDKRQPLGRQFLPVASRRQTQKIQRLRRNKRAMRNQTR